MKIIADENMPMVEDYFSDLGEIIRKPGRSLKAEDVKDADMLLVRSVTKVNKDLLKGSRVKFVGTATIGTDHLDIPWLEANGITWTAAPGCNAISVAEYVVANIALLHKHGKIKEDAKKALVVGVGNVGQKVARVLEVLGYQVNLNDPPRAEQESAFQSQDLNDALDADLICMHAPLHREEPWPSYHLISSEQMEKMKDEAVLLSAGRGEVVDFSALENHLSRFTCCMDVWEPEPDVPLQILERVWVASPHIAGYAIQSKWRGTYMVYCAAMEYLGQAPKGEIPGPHARQKIDASGLKTWYDVVLSVYNPMNDTKTMKEKLLKSDNVAVDFDALRKHYPVRHEFSHCDLVNAELPKEDLELLNQLGLN